MHAYENQVYKQDTSQDPQHPTNPHFLSFYPLWVALGIALVCISICHIGQEGAAWQWGQAVLHREVHGCLQGLSILSQDLMVIFPLSAGSKDTDREAQELLCLSL